MHLKNAPSIQIALGRNTKTTHEPNGIPLGHKSEETPTLLSHKCTPMQITLGRNTKTTH